MSKDAGNKKELLALIDKAARAHLRLSVVERLRAAALMHEMNAFYALQSATDDNRDELLNAYFAAMQAGTAASEAYVAARNKLDSLVAELEAHVSGNKPPADQ